MKSFEESVGGHVRAYKLSATIVAAVECGVFDAIGDGSETCASIADRTDLREDTVVLLLDALAAAGLVFSSPTGYCLSEPARRFLCKDSPQYAGDIVMYHKYAAPRWFALGEVMRDGEAVLRSELFRQFPAFLCYYMGALRRIAHGTSETILSKLSGLPQAGLLVDIGCGPGELAAALLHARHDWRAILVDRVPVQRFVDETLRHHNIDKTRVTVKTCDVLAGGAGLPHGANLALVSHVLHEHPDREAIELLKAARESLGRNGVLAVVDFDARRSGDVSLAEALFQISVMVFLGKPVRARDSDALGHLMLDAGFRGIEICGLGAGVSHNSVLLIGRKEE